MIAFWIALGTDFDGFLVPTWLHFGPKLAPSWAKLAPRWPSSWFKIQVGRTSPQLGRTWLHPGPNLAPLGPILEPTWLQLGSKIQPKGFQTSPRRPWDRFGWIFVAFLMNDRILDRSWDRFCSIFGPNLAPTWHQVGSKLAPKLAENPICKPDIDVRCRFQHCHLPQFRHQAVDIVYTVWELSLIHI